MNDRTSVRSCGRPSGRAWLLAVMVPALVRIGVVGEAPEGNGASGAIFRDRDGKVINSLTVEVLDGRIHTIRAVTNPDKLRHLGPVADTGAVLREAYQAHRSERST